MHIKAYSPTHLDACINYTYAWIYAHLIGHQIAPGILLAAAELCVTALIFANDMLFSFSPLVSRGKFFSVEHILSTDRSAYLWEVNGSFEIWETSWNFLPCFSECFVRTDHFRLRNCKINLIFKMRFQVSLKSRFKSSDKTVWELCSRHNYFRPADRCNPFYELYFTNTWALSPEMW